MLRHALPVLALLATWNAAEAQLAQERVDLSVVQRIRDEGLNRSQIETLAGHLTDVIGPRLTGSTGMKNANEWTAQKFNEWGLRNVQVEPWGEFGKGWERVSYAGRITAPFVQPLNAQPLAWTGSTKGMVEGPVVILQATTPEELRQKYRGKLRNAFVLTQAPAEIGPEFTPITRRSDADDLLAPAQQGGGRGGRGGGPPQAQDTAQFRRQREAAQALAAATDALLRDEGVAASLRPSPWTYGILRAGGAGDRNFQGAEPLPVLMVSHEQYGQLWRNAQRGVPVRLQVDVQNRFLTEDLSAHNTLADLPGTDRADEYVMIGAHLDSWHTGTGATDNAAGSVIMMEAMRILKTLGLQPRRTVRIALWSGEEQGLLGSRAWVRNHADLNAKISAYLNIDNGTGRLRGIWNQSNPAATPIFEQLLWPFRDLGIVAVRHGNTGSTDHIAFDGAGIPGFNFIQDPIEYGVRSHHSNADTFERLMLEDLKQAAVIVASTVYHLAMRDEMVPRKDAARTSTN